MTPILPHATRRTPGAAMLAACLTLAAPATALAAPDPSGIWLRGDGNAQVEIAPCGEQVCATNLWIGDTSRGEEAGDRLIMTLEPHSETRLRGRAYDVKRDRTYSMTLDIVEEGLRTRGCILGGLLCRTVRWTPAR